MPVVKTSAKGQVVIPTAIREKIGLRPGDMVLVSLAPEGKVIIQPVPADPIDAARGMLRGESSLTAALIEERKEENAAATAIAEGAVIVTGDLDFEALEGLVEVEWL